MTLCPRRNEDSYQDPRKERRTQGALGHTFLCVETQKHIRTYIPRYHRQTYRSVITYIIYLLYITAAILCRLMKMFAKHAAPSLAHGVSVVSGPRHGDELLNRGLGTREGRGWTGKAWAWRMK